MTLAKKGLRKTVVNGLTYVWKVREHRDYWGLIVIIGLEEAKGRLLKTGFSFQFGYCQKSDGSWSHDHRVVIDSRLITSIVDYALNNGWNPKVGSGVLFIEMEDKIDLVLKKIIPRPLLKDEQVHLNFLDYETRKVLTTNKEVYTDQGEVYLVFDSFSEAKDFAQKALEADPAIIVCIEDKRKLSDQYWVHDLGTYKFKK